MYLRCSSDFIKFIGDQDHTVEEVLAHLVLRAMAPLQASAAFISVLDNQNSVVTVGRFGIPLEVSGSHEERFNLSDRLPMTDALRLQQNVVVNSLPHWPDEYPILAGIPYPSADAAFISFPIERCGTPFAVASVFLQSKIFLNQERVLFLETLGRILALYLSSPAYLQTGKAKLAATVVISSHSQRGLPLSQRQDLILRMISEGRTNLAIGEILKYSESTIRQETIKIFSKLGCDGRVEASDLYKSHELHRKTDLLPVA
jgi:DNA-binding CsgD family transcriptional regulator